jgi:hypothetical protein
MPATRVATSLSRTATIWPKTVTVSVISRISTIAVWTPAGRPCAIAATEVSAAMTATNVNSASRMP